MLKYVALVLLLSSCSGAWHLQQAVKKGVVIKSDTVYQDRTTIIPGDTTTLLVPVTEIKEKLVTVYQDRIKIQYQAVHDTLMINVECPPDTVKEKIPVYVNTEIDCPPPSPFWRVLALALLVVTALVLYFRR